MEAAGERAADIDADPGLVEAEPRRFRASTRDSGTGGYACDAEPSGGSMKYALVNPNWNFKGSTYFGCHDPHYPLELLFAFDRIREAGHEPFLIDAQNDNLTTEEAKRRVDAFAPDFLV